MDDARNARGHIQKIIRKRTNVVEYYGQREREREDVLNLDW